MADESLNLVRFAGNLVIAAFFAGDNERRRKLKRDELLQQFSESLQTGIRPQEISKAVQDLRSGNKATHPFHWEIEFPEVFGRENSGFDAVVGNPPFMGGMLISTALGDRYRDWLYASFPESGNRMDFVGYFFRQAFTLLRREGALGLIATNTVAQGDTRSGGLRFVCSHGGTIYCARRRYRWPGQAAVVVSVVHIAKGTVDGPLLLDLKNVARITAYLFHSGGHDDPAVLQTNRGRCFIGSNVLGMGFTFDEDDRDGVASSIEQMDRLVSKDRRNAECISRFIGGEELNNSPALANRRFIINFGSLPESEARKWPDLMAILEEKVRPQRQQAKRDAYRVRWWQFGEKQEVLYESTRDLSQVLASCQVGPHLSFGFLPVGWVYAHTLTIFALPTFSAFCIMQSRIHETWTRFFASSMKDDIRYTPTDCFETFPFPDNFETDAKLEAVGKEYYEYRATLMVKNDEGLTKTYNRFHDPNETSAEIKKLRELHAAMDRAVLDAYGWTELKPTCEFLLDYEEEDEDEEDTGKVRKKKKPWRYRWPDEFRDEVLAKLLELNKQRAEQEALAGPVEKPKKAVGRKAKMKNEEPGLFNDQ